MISFKSDVEAVDAFVEKYSDLRAEIAKVIVGQDEVVKKVLISIFSRGMVCLSGCPALQRP
jgi:MoxR-like ATPase